ncbi:MAG: FMN-binding protein [Eubacteriales bacterium]|nr:FMN-binding protein [Eubacteriales bacterium]
MKKNLIFILKTALPLIVICAVCAALLAAANAVTSPIIDENAAKEKVAAIKNLLPDTDSYEEISVDAKGINSLYLVKLSDGSNAYCVDVTAKSKYGGDVNMMVSVFSGESIKAVDAQIISHSETFISKYIDEDGKYTGIDVISGATYSFNAIKDGMRMAESAVRSVIGGEAV